MPVSSRRDLLAAIGDLLRLQSGLALVLHRAVAERFELHPTDLKCLDVAVIVSRGGVLRRRASRPRAVKVQTYVAVRRDGGWLFTAFQNTSRKPLFEWISSRTEPRMAP